MTPLSEDLRRRIVDAHRRGDGTYKILAERFAVGEATISRLLRLHRATGGVRPAPHGGGNPPKISKEQYSALRELVREMPDRTVDRMCHAWKAHHGVAISRAAMLRTLHAAGLTWKKNAFDRRSNFGLQSKRNGKTSARE